MVKELRAWLKEDPENAIIDRSGNSLDLNDWYTEFGIKNIQVAYAEDEHELNSVSVELPENRVQLIKFLLTGLDHTEECEYSEFVNHTLLHVTFAH